MSVSESVSERSADLEMLAHLKINACRAKGLVKLGGPGILPKMLNSWVGGPMGPFLGNDKNRGVSVFCFFNTNVFLELFLWNKKTRMRKTGGHLFLQCKIRAVSAICFYKDVI